MKRTVALLLTLIMLFSIAPLSLAADSQPDEVYDLIGVYHGSYGRWESDHDLTLTVYLENGEVKAIFEFSGYSIFDEYVEGSYYMSVDYSETYARYLLVGTEWIDHSSGYITVDLVGTLSGDVFSNTADDSYYWFYTEREAGTEYKGERPGSQTTPSQSVNDLIGVYKGSYGPYQGTTGLTLTVYEENGTVKAHFDFYNLDGQSNSKEGSYYMDVKYNESTGNFELKGTEWIDQPSGYVFENLTGKLSDNSFTSTEGTTFNLTRTSTTATKPTQPTNPSTGDKPWSNASGWAVPELEKAVEYGLIPDSLTGEDLTGTINRAEFAGVAVKLYETMTGKTATPVSSNPFSDTSNADVLKAYNIGAVNGVSADRYAPYALLNREQAATMLTRVYKKVALPGWTLEDDDWYHLEDFEIKSYFADNDDISDWAWESVYFMASNEIIKGVGNNTFAPKNTTTAQEAVGYANATREAAIIMAVRMVENLY